jgi:site-specific recombinase XerD
MNEQGPRFTRWMISDLVGKAGKRATLGRVHPHVLRHV